MIPPFPLAEWELPPTSPEKLEGVAAARLHKFWEGRNRELLLREVEVAPQRFIIIADEVEAEEESHWVFYEHWIWPRFKFYATSARDSDELRSRILEAGLARFFWTKVSVAEKQCLYLVLFGHKGGGLLLLS